MTSTVKHYLTLRIADPGRAVHSRTTCGAAWEIPLLLGEDAEAKDLASPLALLAEAAVRHAIDGRSRV